MTDEEWAHGMGRLQGAGLPGWPQDQEQSRLRARIYREELSDLAGGAWIHAAREAIRRCKWFPTVSELRAISDEWKPPVRALLEAAPDLSPEERRENTRRGMEMIRAAARKMGMR